MKMPRHILHDGIAFGGVRPAPAAATLPTGGASGPFPRSTISPCCARGRAHSLRAFTMVEIALSLAIIGFALVAIIGVLPAGMSVQKDNREQTVINLDAAYLMDVIRHGPLGQDNLATYIVSLTNSQVARTNGGPSWPVVYVFTPTNSNFPGVVLTNGATIVGMLSTPKYIPIPTNGPPYA